MSDHSTSKTENKTRERQPKRSASVKFSPSSVGCAEENVVMLASSGIARCCEKAPRKGEAKIGQHIMVCLNLAQNKLLTILPTRQKASTVVEYAQQLLGFKCLHYRWHGIANCVSMCTSMSRSIDCPCDREQAGQSIRARL